MITQYLSYFFLRALQNIRENRFLTLVTVAVITVSMLLFSAFLLMYHNIAASLESWGRDVQVSAYLRDNVTEAEAKAIAEQLRKYPQVAEVSYVTKEQAMVIFTESFKGVAGIIDDLGQNPLPASLEIRLHERSSDMASIEAFVGKIKRAEFEDIDFSREWVEKFYTFLSLLSWSGILLGSLLAAASIFIISQTIKLGFYARQDEFAILELVGATPFFIRVPFLIEGFLQGLTGAISAELLLYLAYRAVASRIDASLHGSLGAQSFRFLPSGDLVYIALGGMALGLLGSALSVRKVVGRGRRG